MIPDELRIKASTFLKELRAFNVRRCKDIWPDEIDANPLWWACSAAGEMGEACNALHHTIQGRATKEDIAKEIADTVIYLDLLAWSLGLDSLDELIAQKFNEVSEKKGWDGPPLEPY